MNYARALAALLVALAAGGSSADNAEAGSTSNGASGYFCPDLNPQPSLDLEEIMGDWYVVEVVKHKVDPLRPTSSGRIVVESCPTVRLRFIGRTVLGLLWTERAGNLDYSFGVPDPARSPGFWVANGPQNGTLLARKYTQFVGTVQVMKAVATHMVLTFCSRTPDNQLYSMLLSRKHRLPGSDTTGVQNLLSRRGLTIASVQDTCTNSASREERGGAARWVRTALVAAASLAAVTRATTTASLAF